MTSTQPGPHTPSADLALVNAALTAATTTDAEAVQDRIADSIGGRHERPVGDRPNNHGMIGSSGSYDLKLIELVTNMQDAVVERLAIARWGSPEAVPYSTPLAAAEDLLVGDPLGRDPVRVTFRVSDPPTGSTKRLTAVFRDLGCGLTPGQLPSTVFQLGGNLKEDRLYQQGAFGMGGAMTYRNAEAVVVVSRRAPELLAAGEEDRITVAVVQWEDKTKGSSATYLVQRPWTGPGDCVEPWSCPASHAPDFEPGTHLAVVSYGVEGLQRKREGDERTFDTMVNTRLFRPIMPVRFDNSEITGRPRTTEMRGLARRLADNPGDRPQGTENLPFSTGGVTYHLPVSYWVFAPNQEAGSRRSFAAYNHVVLFLSHGQVHHHWTGPQFRLKTRHKKLADRVLVTVDTDELPIRLRTSLFTADRSELVRNPPALKLEEAVRAFLDDLDPLRQLNSQLIREALTAADTVPTLDIARRIGRALAVKGFALGTGGTGSAGTSPGAGGGGGGEGGTTKPVPLHNDPTRLTGPTTARAQIGSTRSVSFTVDAFDSFFAEGRGRLTATTDHPDITEQELSVGQVRDGRFRVMVAVPEGLDPATTKLTVTLTDWFKAAGGLGDPLTTTTELHLVTELPTRGTGQGKPSGGGTGNAGAGAGGYVAVAWSTPAEQANWNRMTVGEVVNVPARIVAEEKPEYADLAVLGDVEVPLVYLNEKYPPLEDYLRGRSQKNLTNFDKPRQTYGLGVGVHLLALSQQVQARDQAQIETDPDLVAGAQGAAARAVLAVMPEFDDLAKQAGLDEQGQDD